MEKKEENLLEQTIKNLRDIERKLGSTYYPLQNVIAYLENNKQIDPRVIESLVKISEAIKSTSDTLHLAVRDLDGFRIAISSAVKKLNEVMKKDYYYC
jgi:hypothetical protein